MNATTKAIATRWFAEVWNERNAATVHELLAADAVGHMEGAEITGPDQFLHVQCAFLAAFPDLRLVVEHIVADDNMAAVRWHARGTYSGDSLGPAPSGKEFVFRGSTWLHVANGVIVEGWDFWNQGALLKNLAAA